MQKQSSQFAAKPSFDFDPTSPLGYASVVADKALQLANQDTLDAYFGQRVVDVRRDLRETGWEDTPRVMQLRKGNVTVEFDPVKVGSGANVIGGVWKLLRSDEKWKEIARVPDDLSLTPANLAQEIDQAKTIAESRIEQNLRRAPQELLRSEFAEIATAKKLVNHGRRWEVFFGEQSMGFCDSIRAEDAVGEAHEGEVNNALHAHLPEAPDFMRPAVFPSEAVLDEYPELRVKFVDVFEARRTTILQLPLDFAETREVATPAPSAITVDSINAALPPMQGTFVGKIVGVADSVVTQKVGRDGRTVEHSLSALTRPVAIGEVVEIQYAKGQGRVTSLDHPKEKGIS